MKLKKGKRSRKFFGSRTHGWAAKKHKGKGNKGGKGMSGSGKKAGQKISFVNKYFHPYFGKKGKLHAKAKEFKINLKDIEMMLENMLKKGIAKRGKDGIEIHLDKYKILGDGNIKDKIVIYAMAFSASAREKIEKAGGKAIAVGKKE